MQAVQLGGNCPDCSCGLVDVGDELVCQSCGATAPKETWPDRDDGPSPQSPGSMALGSYMGRLGAANARKFARAITGIDANFKYLKTISDFSGRNGGSETVCARLIERVGEKLFLPAFVLAEAQSISRKVLGVKDRHRRLTVASVSAYSLIAACKVTGVASASVRDIVDAHAALGKQVTSSSLIQLSLDSPVKTQARRPEDYVSFVLARLSKRGSLADPSTGTEPSEAFVHSLRGTAIELLEFLGEESRAGRRPSAMAASAVYSAEMVLADCESRRRRLTQRDLAECGDSAEYTIREQCAQIFMPAVRELVVRRSRSLTPQTSR